MCLHCVIIAQTFCGHGRDSEPPALLNSCSFPFLISCWVTQKMVGKDLLFQRLKHVLRFFKKHYVNNQQDVLMVGATRIKVGMLLLILWGRVLFSLLNSYTKQMFLDHAMWFGIGKIAAVLELHLQIMLLIY